VDGVNKDFIAEFDHQKLVKAATWIEHVRVFALLQYGTGVLGLGIGSYDLLKE
jgi:hypothetical protein